MTTTKRGPGRPAGTFKHTVPTRINGKVTKTYSAWQAMVQRCTNQNSHNWKWYGGKGVTVCARWIDKATGYDAFIADMGAAPDGLTLGRIDNTKPYEPGNCAWQTWREQANNRTKPDTRKPDSIRQQSIRAGQPYHRVIQRLRAGWTMQESLTLPGF